MAPSGRSDRKTLVAARYIFSWVLIGALVLGECEANRHADHHEAEYADEQQELLCVIHVSATGSMY